MVTKLMYINQNLTLQDVIKLYPSATVLDIEDLLQGALMEIEDYQKEIQQNEARIEALEDELKRVNMKLTKLTTLPELPEPCIYESDASPLYDAPVGYTIEQVQNYGKLCHNTALDEAIALIDILSGCSLEYIKDRLMYLKG